MSAAPQAQSLAPMDRAKAELEAGYQRAVASFAEANATLARWADAEAFLRARLAQVEADESHSKWVRGGYRIGHQEMLPRLRETYEARALRCVS